VRPDDTLRVEQYEVQQSNRAPETGYNIPSAGDQELILRDLRAIADHATIYSEWTIWLIIRDGYALREREMDIEQSLRWAS
jgi:hypothetical protein